MALDSCQYGKINQYLSHISLCVLTSFSPCADLILSYCALNVSLHLGAGGGAVGREKGASSLATIQTDETPILISLIKSQ